MSEVSPADGTDRSASWNVDTLFRYVENSMKLREEALAQSFAGRDKAVEAAFVAQEKAVATALNAQKEAVAAALTAQKEAVNKAENASEKRFESVNEFRAQLADQNKTFATRNDLDNLKEQMNKLENAQSRGQGTMDGTHGNTDRLVQIIPILIALAALFIAFMSLKGAP